MSFEILERGDEGQKVLQWQTFLQGQGYNIGALDGIFGKNTFTATVNWQTRNNLQVDGRVGKNTWNKAFTAKVTSNLTDTVLNVPVTPKPTFDLSASDSSSALAFPPKPSFGYANADWVNQTFGKFNWKPNGKSEIIILGDWVERNIIDVKIDVLDGVPFAPRGGIIRFHRLGVTQLLGAFNEIKEKGLGHLILSFGGSFYPRMIRGSSTQLSNHSHGTALDLNAPENWLNKEPAKAGQKGCLYALVPIFNKWGFFWGGAYSNRKDVMHFEIAKLIS